MMGKLLNYTYAKSIVTQKVGEPGYIMKSEFYQRSENTIN